MTLQRDDSEVSICNQALSLIKHTSITSFDQPNNVGARECKLHYAVTRDRLLREYRWNFNTRRITLAHSGEALFEFKNKYAKPGDVLRVINLDGATDTEWTVEGDDILTDLAPPVNARVLLLVPEPIKWDAHFAELMYHELAVKIAPKVAPRRNIATRVLNRLEDLRDMAKPVDAREGREQLPETVSEFVAVRAV